MKDRRLRRADLILIAILLAAGVLMSLGAVLFSRAGGTVVVRVDGEVVASYPLSEDREAEIAGVNGGVNRLVIRDGSAWIEEASCPDGLCVGMGVIRRAGQSIICLPNRVVVEIAGSGAPETDAVSE